MNWFTKILNWFRSNQTITRIAVQEAAFAAVQRRPALKPVLARVTSIVGQLAQGGGVIGAAQLAGVFTNKMNEEIAKLTPEQRLLLGPAVADLMTAFTEVLAGAAGKYLGSKTPGPEQVKATLQIMGWIQEAANMVGGAA